MENPEIHKPKIHILKMPMTKELAKFIAWSSIEILLIAGICTQLEFSYTMSLLFDGSNWLMLGINVLVFLISSFYYIGEYGIYEWLYNNVPRLRVEWK